MSAVNFVGNCLVTSNNLCTPFWSVYFANSSSCGIEVVEQVLCTLDLTKTLPRYLVPITCNVKQYKVYIAVSFFFIVVVRGL